MTDYSELKRLAEAFPDDLDFDSNTEPFFNGPSGESLGGGSTGFYSVYGKPFFIEGDDYEYDGPTYVESCNVDFAKFIVAAREGVLELLAEAESLRAQHGRDSAELRNLCQARDDARKERDKLKAENEALRKDAERYRFLKTRTQQADIELAVCLHDKRTQVTVFLDGEYVDSQTDIAMSQEVKP